MVCKNCVQEINGNFCQDCGQKSNVKRISREYIFQEIPDSILQINHGFLFTIKQLTLEPGKTIAEFLEGKRQAYYKPFAFFLITSTIYLLLAYLRNTNTFIDDFLLGFKTGVNENSDSSLMTVVNLISENQTYFILILLPLYSFASYLAFKKSVYNYYEHLVINLYITGYQMIIYTLLGFVFYTENLLMLVPIIVGMIYNFWTFRQLFDKKKFINITLLLLLTYLIFIIEIMLLMLSFAGISHYLK